MILIIGGDSFIGEAIGVSCSERALPFQSTTRRRDGRKMHLDLTEVPSDWRIPEGVSSVILCAAATGLKRCEENPDETRAINVRQTLALASLSRRSGAFFVFLSSDQVFAPGIGPTTESDPTDPINEYGRQKAEAETALLQMLPEIAIVRLSKVVAPSLALFREWVHALRRGETIHPYEDLTFYPIGRESVARDIIEIAMERRGGVHHIAGNSALTYADAAKVICDTLGFDGNLCVPIRSPGGPAQSRPLTTTRVDGSKGLGGKELIRRIALEIA